MQPALKIYEMVLAQRDRGNLHVTLYSPPERAQLKGIMLLIHQCGENADRYRIMAKEALVPAGYALMVPDLPGCGQSWGVPGQGQLDEALEAIELCQELLAQQTPELPHFLFGHGTGALLVLEYLQSRPASQGFYHAALISSPYLRQRREPSELRYKFWSLLARFLPNRTCRLRIPPECLTDDRRVLMDREQDSKVHDRCSYGLRLSFRELGQRLPEETPKLALPLLMMYGGAEQWLSLQSLRDFAQKLPEYMNSIEWPHFLFDLHTMQDRRSYYDTVIEYLELCLQRGLHTIPQAEQSQVEAPSPAEAAEEESELGPEGERQTELLETEAAASEDEQAEPLEEALAESEPDERDSELQDEEDEPLFPQDWAQRHQPVEEQHD